MPSRTHLYDLLVSTIFTEGLDEMDLWALGFSATWIKGADLDALHLDAATRTPCHLHEILDRAIDDGSSWVAEVNGWVGIVPGHGSDESLRSISEGGREVLGLRMDISSREHFTYARDGRVLVAFEPHRPDERSGDDPHVLDHLMYGLCFELSIDDPDDLVEAPESISSTLALIGRVTGTDMAADWFLARHSSLRPRS